MKTSLWPHQRDTIEELRCSIGKPEAGGRGKRRPLVQSPTGSGKTILAAAIIEEANERARERGQGPARVAFTVPAISLIDQTAQAFWEEGIRDVGIIQADHRGVDWSKPVQICSVDTLGKRKSYPICNFVIVDEAHVCKKAITEWMKEDERRIFIGLSATPWRQGLGRIYDDLIVAASIDRLIADGILSGFKCFAPSHPDLEGVDIERGDYVRSQLSKKANQKALVGDVVEHWKKLGQDRPTICFCVDLAHARLLQERFKDAGVSAAYVDHKMPLNERSEVARDFDRGAVKVVCNVDCLGVGVDWDIRCLILARPTRSVVRYVQNVGRGLRSAPGKDHLLILDHSDTTLRLGFVSDIKRDKLSTAQLGSEYQAEQEPPKPLPKPCPSCAFVKPAGVWQCPKCGFIPERKTSAKHINGSLVEFDEEARKAQKDALRKNKTKQATLEEKLTFYRMVKGWALAHGKAPGWVAWRYRDMFGVWPRGFGDPPGMRPSPEVESWIRSRQIAYAKSAAKQKAWA